VVAVAAETVAHEAGAGRAGPAPVGHGLGRAFPWLVVAVTVSSVLAVDAWAPRDRLMPSAGLAWLLFVGSSVHVAATATLFAFSEVRGYARQRARRFIAFPLGCLVVSIAAYATLPREVSARLLLVFFGWQFWHYQKQNLGLAALAASATGAPRLGRLERAGVRCAGIAGVMALVAHPVVLQLVPLRPPAELAGAMFTASRGLLAIAFGMTLAACLHRRLRSSAGGIESAAVLLLAAAFPAPLMLTQSPYLALGGLTLAHGLQYLLLVGLVVVGPTTTAGRLAAAGWLGGAHGVLLLAGVLALAGALAAASHLHTGPGLTGAVFGAYVGIVVGHFLLDAGLWRLRDPFPRRWLSQRLPSLLPTPSAADTSLPGVG
jgi:hypothetical protein